MPPRRLRRPAPAQFFPFESSRGFPRSAPNFGHGDHSRLSCSAGDTQLGAGFRRDLQQALWTDVGHRSASPRRHEFRSEDDPSLAPPTKYVVLDLTSPYSGLPGYTLPDVRGCANSLGGAHYKAERSRKIWLNAPLARVTSHEPARRYSWENVAEGVIAAAQGRLDKLPTPPANILRAR
jgi:hypothetical protein